jgi:uncharacterized protein (TIGR02246 family)
MQRKFLATLRVASFAVMPALLLVLSAACNDESEVTGPLVARQSQAAEADLGAIPTDPILDIISALTAAWTAKDAAAYAAPYAVDLQFINPAGVVISGRDAFRDLHVFLFNGPFAGSTLTIAVRDIQFLTGTIAIVYLDESLTGFAALPPGVPSSGGVVHTRATWVVEKRGGEWQIVFQQLTSQL